MCGSGCQGLDCSPPGPADWATGFRCRRTGGTQTPYFEFTGQVEAPANSRWEIRVLRLANQMRVMCVSDPDAQQSAASLAIGVGSSADPPEFAGLAHALEHALFLGTAKYPGESDFSEYLSRHAGSSNATTQAQTTHYHFAVNNSGLRGALDRLAQLFVSPLLDDGRVEREMAAVESEFRTGLLSDAKRGARMAAHACCPEHPLSRFAGGNRGSLLGAAAARGVRLRDQLAGFFTRHYSADIMALVVVGRAEDGVSLDTLAEWAVDAFSVVPSRGDTRPPSAGHPLCARRLGKAVFFESVGELSCISLSFALPQTGHQYMAGAGLYARALLEHRGSGSLVAHLRRMGWATSVWAAGDSWSCDAASVYRVEVSATPAGIEHYREVVASVFAYLGVVQAQGAREWHLAEAQRASAIDFHTQPPSPARFATQASIGMCSRYLRPEHAVSGTRLLHTFDPEAAGALLSQLSPANCSLICVAPRAPAHVQLAKTEPAFGMRYGEEDLCPEATTGLDKHAAQMHFPLPNRLLPEQLGIGAGTQAAASVCGAPALLERSRLLELWTQEYRRGPVASGCIHLRIETAAANVSPLTQVYLTAMCMAVEDGLADELGMGARAGIHSSITAELRSIVIRLCGVQEGQPLLLQPILSALFKPSVDEDRLAFYLDRMRQTVAPYRAEPPAARASRQHRAMRATPRWHSADIEAELGRATLSGMRGFIDEALGRVRLTMLVVGAYSNAEAVDVAAQAVAALGVRDPIPDVLQMQVRAPAIGASTYIQRLESSSADSAVDYAVFAGGPANSAAADRDRALLALVVHLLRAPFYEQLRTKEQLGYNVRCSWAADDAGGPAALRLAVQGGSSPEYACLRIEAFLVAFRARLAAMCESEIVDAAGALAVSLRVLPGQASDVAGRSWARIADGSYDFGHVDARIAQLASLRHRDVLAFWDAFVGPAGAPGGLTRLIVLVGPTAVDEDALAEHPLPVIALHACLAQARANTPSLADVGRFVARHRGTSAPDAAQCRLLLAKLCGAAPDDGRARVALEMALQPGLPPPALLAHERAVHPGPDFTSAGLRRTHSGAWLVPDRHAFLAVHGLHAPNHPRHRLVPKRPAQPTAADAGPGSEL